jgi:hypothetical protein
VVLIRLVQNTVYMLKEVFKSLSMTGLVENEAILFIVMTVSYLNTRSSGLIQSFSSVFVRHF